MDTNHKPVASNRKAYHDYTIEETLEAGLVLTGTEIKSIRLGRVNLREAYARVDKGEGWLVNAHIAQYPGGNRYNHEPTRSRKLLLRRKELDWLVGKTREKGYTLVPLRLYIRRGYAKIELGLGRGKRAYDKREAIARRDAQRDIERALKDRDRETWGRVVSTEGGGRRDAGGGAINLLKLVATAIAANQKLALAA